GACVHRLPATAAAGDAPGRGRCRRGAGGCCLPGVFSAPERGAGCGRRRSEAEGWKALGGEAVAAEQGVGLRFAAAEGDEGFERRARAADGEDLAAEALADGVVEDPGFLEGGEG